MSERVLVDFREDESVLDMATDQRMRQRIAELTRNQPDADGEWPFRTEPVPLERGERDGAGREVTAAAAVVAGAHRSRRLMAVAAAVLAVVLVGGALVVQFSGTDSTTQFGGESIESITTLAGQQPDHPLGPGEYLHQTWEELMASDVSLVQSAPVRIDRWTAIDGTGREVSDLLGPAPSGVSTSHLVFDVSYNELGRSPFAWFSYEQLRSLPTDAAVLLEEISATLGIPTDDAYLLAGPLAELLMVEVAPPGVRAAAFEALNGLSAQPLGVRTDRAGRDGLAFAVEGARGIVSIIVDPMTSAVLEWRSSPRGVEPSAENATSWRTVLAQQIVASRD